ncbi:MAG TPA: ATP-binding protein [Cyclobacteriaceae bacterium]|nr:ATP-binding protein [Cyclobacteriaceae bacterium]
MIKIFTSLLFVILTLTCAAQDYHFKQYRVEDGLPSDIIKSCTQDSLGYFWIATDDGLVKYDGIKFTTYHEPLHSSFVKGLVHLKGGRLFAYGDLDFLEIKNLGDTVIFRPIVLVSRATDSRTLSYPKAIYEDHHGDIWISESQSVVRLHGNYIKRFQFDIADRSPQFLRSFSFFEDRQNNFFATSFQGNVFYFNPISDQFESKTEKLPYAVEHISSIDNRLLIGCESGFYESFLPESGGFSVPKLKLKKPNISFIAPLSNEKYFIATRGTEHFVVDTKQNTVSTIPYPVNSVNHVYVSQDHDVWLSGNDGLILLKDNLIHQASDFNSIFIEAITEDPFSGKIFYATSPILYSFDRAEKKNKQITSIPSGYFQSLAFSKKGIWAANAFTVYLFKDGNIFKKFDFSSGTLFVVDIFNDSNDNLWVAQPGKSVVYMIDSELNTHQFKIPLGREGVINLVREGNDGIYIGSTGKNSYLFYKSKTDSVFTNVSVPVQFDTHGDFTITGIVFMNNKIWLASSEGLLRLDKQKIERVNLGPAMTGLSVKTVVAYKKNRLLFANVHGLILYDPVKGSYDLFNESNGLLSNTITPRGLFVSHDDGVWIGTSKGLSYINEALIESQKTPTPRVVDLRANGKKISLRKGEKIAYGSFIAASVSSITFPETEVIFQYRVTPKEDWKLFNGSILNLSDLAPGKHAIEVRAKKNGPFAWSDSTPVNFHIGNPFWLQTWFLLACVFIAGFLVIVSIVLANIRNNKRRRELELLIDERTNALRISNEELFIRNNELDRFVYSASHDLSAPLKSILGLITVAQMEKPTPEINQYLDLMKRSVLKLDSFIKDIISYSRNARLPVKKVSISFNGLIESVWADHQFTPNVDKIKFQLVNNMHSEFYSDETRLRIIFNNLISNAIKFHRPNHNPFINITASELPEHFEFKVEDNGMGISPDLKDKIFDMFFRATETVQGSGLGLYILKEALSRLKGTVTVESTLGEGTTFIITLPKEII